MVLLSLARSEKEADQALFGLAVQYLGIDVSLKKSRRATTNVAKKRKGVALRER